MFEGNPEARADRLVLHDVQALSADRSVPPAISVGDDGVVEPLSVVSRSWQRGNELHVNVMDLGIELRCPMTLGKLVSMARTLSSQKSQQTINRSARP
jgi:hypothetical protein